MVVDEVQNFYPGAIDEEEVGDIGLPAFVGHDCFKPDVGAVRLLLRLWGYKSGAGNDAADCRC